MEHDTTTRIDYKSNFRVSIDALYAAPPPLDDLLTQIRDLADAYIAATGERPDARQLDRLATLIVKASEEANKAIK